MARNPRYYAVGGWKARERMLQIVRTRAASGEVCAICGQPIDLTLPQTFIDPKDGKRKRAPWSLECDEIIPVSRGGSPVDADNIRPTHRVCNQRRGNGVTHAPKSPQVPHDEASGSNAKRW